MEKIKAIIVEDIEKDYELIKLMLSEYHPEVELVGIAKGVNTGYELIKSISPDIVFFDIEIEERGTSFDIIDRFLENSIPITFEAIFITAYKEHEYTTKAFDYAAIDYITKPFDKHALTRAIERAKEKLSNRGAAEKLQMLIEVLKKGDSVSTKLTVHLANNNYTVLTLDDIKYVKADQVLSHFHLKDGSQVTAFRNLGQYRKILELDHNFFSISHNLTLNLDYLKTYNHKEKTVLLIDGEVVTASRLFGSKLLHHLKENQPQRQDSLFTKLKSFLNF